MYDSLFKWKYPLWYSHDIKLEHCTLFETARAGIWYTENIKINDSMIEAPKTFRRSKNITLTNVDLPNAAETLWNCSHIAIKNASAKGDYFGMNCDGLYIDGLRLVGNYCFDGAKNINIRNSRLLSKDSFWNAENVIVRDSFISGEYLAWNARNITFIRCTIESLQGLCYIDGLTMKDCRLINTNLAFEYSTAEAEIEGHIVSVKNPSGGHIKAGSIGELIMEPERVDVTKTVIEYGEEESEDV